MMVCFHSYKGSCQWSSYWEQEGHCTLTGMVWAYQGHHSPWAWSGDPSSNQFFQWEPLSYSETLLISPGEWHKVYAAGSALIEDACPGQWVIICLAFESLHVILYTSSKALGKCLFCGQLLQVTVSLLVEYLLIGMTNEKCKWNLLNIKSISVQLNKCCRFQFPLEI